MQSNRYNHARRYREEESLLELDHKRADKRRRREKNCKTSVSESILRLTQTHRDRNDFFRDFVHHTRLSSSRRIYDVGMKSSPFFEVHRDD